MQDINTTNSTDPTLSKLLEVEADLAAQESQILTQLATINEKRKSLQSVIGMFSSGTASTADIVDVATQTGTTIPAEALANSTELASVVAEAASTGVTSNGSTAEAAPAKRERKTGATAGKTKKAPKTSKAPTKRGQDLQKYMRSEFGGTSLPQAVSQILQRQPNEVVGIPDVIDSIFVDETPKAVRSKASARIATILSTGLKDNKWYRGKTGHYSLSESAASADLAS